MMLGQLDKEGHYISLTKNRFTLIEKELLREARIPGDIFSA